MQQPTKGDSEMPQIQSQFLRSVGDSADAGSFLRAVKHLNLGPRLPIPKRAEWSVP